MKFHSTEELEGARDFALRTNIVTWEHHHPCIPTFTSEFIDTCKRLGLDIENPPTSSEAAKATMTLEAAIMDFAKKHGSPILNDKQLGPLMQFCIMTIAASLKPS